MKRAAAFSGYMAAIVAANWMTVHLGFVPVGFGLTATAGTIAAGLALFFRDLLQDAAGRRVVLVAILIGAAVSIPASTLRLGLASATAFLLAELLDMHVYTRLRQKGWARAVLWSNAVGAVADTLVFLRLAGFSLTATLVWGQLIGKILWATLLPVAAVTGFRRIRSARSPVEAVAK